MLEVKKYYFITYFENTVTLGTAGLGIRFRISGSAHRSLAPCENNIEINHALQNFCFPEAVNGAQLGFVVHTRHSTH